MTTLRSLAQLAGLSENESSFGARLLYRDCFAFILFARYIRDWGADCDQVASLSSTSVDQALSSLVWSFLCAVVLGLIYKV